MTFALLYDVHGNLPALEAVLADAAEQGANRHLLGGDYALFGPWPVETLAALDGLAGAVWLRGNGERWTASPGDAPPDDTVQGAIAAAREALGADADARLGGLPEQAVIGGWRACHASPISDVRSFRPAAGADDIELAGGVRERRLTFGHTHLPFRRPGPDGIELCNPGSVGMPFDGDHRAAYALVHPDGAIEHRRVDYEHAASAAARRARFPGRWSEVVATRLERARLG
jgi:diadenosine tetraphosphatase ApaH/serine/threonine PP2A family protein phosphatase